MGLSGNGLANLEGHSNGWKGYQREVPFFVSAQRLRCKFKQYNYLQRTSKALRVGER